MGREVCFNNIIFIWISILSNTCLVSAHTHDHLIYTLALNSLHHSLLDVINLMKCLNFVVMFNVHDFLCHLMQAIKTVYVVRYIQHGKRIIQSLSLVCPTDCPSRTLRLTICSTDVHAAGLSKASTKQSSASAGLVKRKWHNWLRRIQFHCCSGGNNIVWSW